MSGSAYSSMMPRGDRRGVTSANQGPLAPWAERGPGGQGRDDPQLTPGLRARVTTVAKVGSNAGWGHVQGFSRHSSATPASIRISKPACCVRLVFSFASESKTSNSSFLRTRPSPRTNIRRSSDAPTGSGLFRMGSIRTTDVVNRPPRFEEGVANLSGVRAGGRVARPSNPAKLRFAPALLANLG
jgi:hypothetical protein